VTAELLRRAAAKIRETAAASYPGPWRWDENYGRDGDTGLALTNDAGDEVVGAYNYHCCDFRDDPTVRDQEKAHIALWSPDVALIVASWLDASANAIGQMHDLLEFAALRDELDGTSEASRNPDHADVQQFFAEGHPVSIARLILQEQP